MSHRCKLSSISTDENKDKLYIGGVEYSKENNSWKPNFLSHGNGRILISDMTNPRYQYMLKDHLGNVVVYFEDKNHDGYVSSTSTGADAEILQRNYYYPFGMPMEGGWETDMTPDQNYLYNGKEKIGEGIGLNWLAYGFRMYDPAIGRFPSVDPIAHKFAHVSPYNYAENEPIQHIDLWGLQKFIIHRYFSRGELSKTSISYRLHKGKIIDNGAVEANVLVFNYDSKGNFTGSDVRDGLNKLEKAILIKGNRNIGRISEFKDKHGYSFNDGLKESETSDLMYSGANARDVGSRVYGYSDEEMVKLLIPRIGNDDIVEYGTIGFSNEANRSKNNGNAVKLLNTIIKPLVPNKTVEIVKNLGIDDDGKPFEKANKVRVYKINNDETF